jgi:glyoxylase-like metal-dependent hydrolase (beta-lactamase superfamily II)
MLRPRPIARGIESFAARTPTLPPATHTNSYALGERQVLLVEPATPYDDEQQAWVDWVRSLKAQGRELLAIVLTHHHPDHVGGAEALARELGLPLWAHEETANRLPQLSFARLLRDGERLNLAGPLEQCWRILHTPGHAAGHVCLFEADARYLVVGDMVASVGTILIDPYDGDMRTYLRELERLAELSVDCALPAHGDPIATPAQLFRFYIEHRLIREGKVLRALREHGAEGATVEELLPTAYADTARAAWPLAALSVRAHLVKLVADGLVRVRDERHVAA